MARSSTSGQGRPKGVPNKITADLKAMILKALSDAGGVEYLRRVAKKNPGAFLTLLGKVLPMTLTGPDGELPSFHVDVHFGGNSREAEKPQAPPPPQASSPGPSQEPAKPEKPRAPLPPWIN